MKPIISLMKKDIKLLFKDKMAVFFTFFFPLIFAFFFGAIFSSGGGSSAGMRVAVTDLDSTTQSQSFVQKLKESEQFRVEETTEENGKSLVRQGKKVAYIILPQGFGENYSGLFSGSAPELLIGIDPSRKAEAGYLEGSLMQLGIGRFQDAFGNSDQMLSQLDKAIADVQKSDNLPSDWKNLLGDYLPQVRELTQKEVQKEAQKKAQNNANDKVSEGNNTNIFGGDENPLMPLKITKQDVSVKKSGPKNTYSITIPQGVIWAIMGCVIGFAVSLVQEKTLGTINRLALAPITRTQILAGKALGCFVAQLFVVALLFVIAYFILNVRFDLLKLVLAVVAIGVCFVGVMMFFASLAKTERSVAGLTNAFLIIMGMIGGAMIPLFVMPSWMQTISNISPVKWSILALEGAIWRDFSYVEMMQPIIILLVVGLVAFFAGTRMLKLEQA